MTLRQAQGHGERSRTVKKLAILALLAIVLATGAAGVWAPEAGAQGTRKDDIVINSRGFPQGGANVAVCAQPAVTTTTPCSPLANLFSNPGLTQALVNPLTTDGLGNYSFYAAPGKYTIQIYGTGITTKVIPDVILPSDPANPSFTTVTTTSGITAFSLTLSGNLTVAGSAAAATLTLSNQGTAPGTPSADFRFSRLSIRALSIGVNVKLTSSETIMAKDIVSAIDLKKRPGMLCINATGRKITTSDKVVAITAIPISFVASIAAANGSKPFSSM